MAAFLASAGYLAVAGALGLSIASLVSSFTRRRFRGRSRYRFRRSVHGGSRALERTMELIRREDVTGCGMRLLCELARLRQDHITGEEQAILDLVGPAIDPWSGVSPRGALQEYKTAKGFGEAGGDCGKVFSLCPLNGTQLMETVLGYVS
ncbi:uncharacterized protein [Panulirus ornatus]|uniref:uncharacterized protein n=1 Tax=Panulirus ornatus TaxID=150431 RepID=UPI003A8A45ED